MATYARLTRDVTASDQERALHRLLEEDNVSILPILGIISYANSLHKSEFSNLIIFLYNHHGVYAVAVFTYYIAVR